MNYEYVLGGVCVWGGGGGGRGGSGLLIKLFFFGTACVGIMSLFEIDSAE